MREVPPQQRAQALNLGHVLGGESVAQLPIHRFRIGEVPATERPQQAADRRDPARW